MSKEEKHSRMALVYNRNSIDITPKGGIVYIPDHSKAKLMYYLDCMCTVLSLDQTEHNIRRLTDYNSYNTLTDGETAAMVLLSTLLDPVTLNDVCIFHDEEACRGTSNQFFEINARRTTLAAAESVMVGNVRVTVNKIMCYKMDWLKFYYLDPLSYFVRLFGNAEKSRRQQQPQVAYYEGGRSDDDSCCCVIL